MTNNNPSAIIDRLHNLEDAIRRALSELEEKDDFDRNFCAWILKDALNVDH